MRVHSNPSDSRPPDSPHARGDDARRPGALIARVAARARLETRSSRALTRAPARRLAADRRLSLARASADDPGSDVDAPADGDAPEPPPKWMEILEESAEWDPDVKELLDGANANPAEVEDRIRKRSRSGRTRCLRSARGAPCPCWCGSGSSNRTTCGSGWSHTTSIAEQEEPLVDEVFKAWFVLGKLGGFNSENMQVQSNFFEVSRMDDDMELANGESDVPACVFHAMGGPEYKGRWARAWFDLGSADEMCVDVLINAFIQLSREYFGIKTLVIGGENAAPDWPAAESEFFVDDSGEMDVMVDESGPFRAPPPGTTKSGGMMSR